MDLETPTNLSFVKNITEEVHPVKQVMAVDIVVSGKPPKAEKKTFDAECGKCHKHFKSKGTFDKHVGQQLCYSKNELSYCKTCNITLDSHSGYIKHLMTAKHLESIGAGKLERLQEDRPGAIHTADPYLSSNEAELLGTRNLGEKYTLVFENNETQEVKLVRKPSPTIMTTSAKNTTLADVKHNTADKEMTAPDKIIQPTSNQLGIIKYLEKQTNPVEANNSFIKILTTKLAIEDYYGLTTLIRENGEMSLDIKKTILGLINKFVDGLTKKRAGGQATYNGKDIAKVVVALSM